MSLFKLLFGSFPNTDKIGPGYSNHKRPQKQKSLSDSIVGTVLNDFKKVAADIDHQITRRK